MGITASHRSMALPNCKLLFSYTPFRIGYRIGLAFLLQAKFQMKVSDGVRLGPHARIGRRLCQPSASTREQGELYGVIDYNILKYVFASDVCSLPYERSV
eukprot:2800705-Amphidinium_carterae.1